MNSRNSVRVLAWVLGFTIVAAIPLGALAGESGESGEAGENAEEWMESFDESQESEGDDPLGTAAGDPDTPTMDEEEWAVVDNLDRKIDRERQLARYYEALYERMDWEQFMEGFESGYHIDDLHLVEVFGRGGNRIGRFVHDGSVYEIGIGGSVAGQFEVEHLGLDGAVVRHAGGIARLGLIDPQEISDDEDGGGGQGGGVFLLE